MGVDCSVSLRQCFSPYYTIQSQQWLPSMNGVSAWQLPCSSDLATSDFHLCSKLEKKSCTHYHSDENVILVIGPRIGSLQNWYSLIEVFKCCWQKCVKKGVVLQRTTTKKQSENFGFSNMKLRTFSHPLYF